MAAEYNRQYVDAMIQAAQGEFKRAGAVAQVERVPGAYEIPLAAAELARGSSDAKFGGGFAAIVCLGVIIRGETAHAGLIGEAVSQALMRIQLEHGIPVIHGVLLLENEEQARVRCLPGKHNRGTEAARTALEMAEVMAGLKGRVIRVSHKAGSKGK